MNRRLRVAVLYGGTSTEHEVSVTSARGVIRALDAERYDVVPIAIARDGKWLLPTRSPADLPLEHGTLPPVDPDDGIGGALERIGKGVQLVSQRRPIDVCFPVLHGTGGEDGAIQGFLETLGVPYVGSGVAASALAMHKHLAKPVLVAAGIPVVPWVTVSASDLDSRWDDLVDEAIGRFGFPLFCKPSAQGSSVGVHKVRDADALVKALADAMRYDGVALIEQAIAGREIECAVLGNDEAEASVVGEITPCNEFYDYEAKYLADGSILTIPAQLDMSLTERIRRLALDAFKTLGCQGLARVDFFVRDDEVWCNELNTMPGFTPISMYPKLWESSGLPYPGLLDRLIELALDRHARAVR